MRITCPPITHACHFGVDMGHDGDLIAARLTVEEMREHIGADIAGVPVARRDDAGHRRPGGRATTTATATPASPGSYPMHVGDARPSWRSRACWPDDGSLVIGRRPRAGDRLGVPAPRPRGRASPPSSAPRRRRRRSRDRRARGSARRRRGRRVRPPRASPCFGPPPTLARLESSKALRPRARRPRSASRRPAFGRFDDADDGASRGGTTLGAPGRRQARRPRRRQGRHRAGRPTPRPSRRSPRLAAAGPIVLEERLTAPSARCSRCATARVPCRCRSPRTTSASARATPGPTPAAWAPTRRPRSRYDADELAATFVQPVVDHLAATGTPYVGVLYAGLMLTADGPRLLEFNCRFGDPEAQAVLPLLDDRPRRARAGLHCDGALADTALVVRSHGARVHRRRRRARLSGRTRSTGAADHPISMRRAPRRSLTCSTPALDRRSTPSRSPAAGCWPSPGSATISPRRVAPPTTRWRRSTSTGCRCDATSAGARSAPTLTSYAAAGVDIDEGNRAVVEMKAAVERTHGTGGAPGVGSFGGAFSGEGASWRWTSRCSWRRPTASAPRSSSPLDSAWYRGVGTDIVNHCIDDVLVQGARPLFFLDYIAASELDAEHGRRGGHAAWPRRARRPAARCSAARRPRCPASTQPGAFDIAGTLVGRGRAGATLLPRARRRRRRRARSASASNGPHTNGYSLLRKMFDWLPMDVVPAGFDRPLGERCSSRTAATSRAAPALGRGRVKALAHITGGGLPENLPRVLPDDVRRRDRTRLVAGAAAVPTGARAGAAASTTDELYRTLNMGIGMVVVCAADRRRRGAGSRSPSRPGSSANSCRTIEQLPPAGIDGCTCDEPRLVVLASGDGQQPAGDPRRLRRRATAGRRGRRRVRTVPDAGALAARRRCRRAGRARRRRTPDEARADYDARLADIVAGFDPDWVVLAGWMRMLTMSFLGWFPGMVVNLHPALPGELPGTHAIERALARGPAPARARAPA